MFSIEKSFIGTCLNEPERIQMNDVKPEEFESYMLGSMWKLMLSGCSDPMSLSKEFKGQQDSVISDCVMEACPSAFERHAKKITEEHSKRQFIAVLTNAIADVEKGSDVDSVASQVAKSSISASESGFTHCGDIASEVYAELMDNSEHEKGSDKFIPTGFSDLDFVTGGIERGNLIIVAARPSMGKTALAMGVCLNASKDYSVTFSSIEMDNASVGYRMLSSVSELDLRLLRTGSIKSQDAWSKAAGAMATLCERNFYIDDNPRRTFAQISTQCRKHKLKYGLDVVMVDYIGLLGADDKRKKRHEQVGDVTRGAKLLAKELNCAVILLCQLNRDAEGQRPNLSHLRESGDVEQDADIILFPYREDKESEDVVVIVGKNRNGPCVDVEMKWHGATASFKSKPAFGFEK